MSTLTVTNDAETRSRLSGAAVRGFLGLAAAWSLKTDEQTDLLGASVSRSTLRNWADDSSHVVLSADQLMRVSFLLGIFEGLARIWRHVPLEADAWVRRPNADEPFGGRSPLEYMRSGGIPALANVRAYVDSATGGPPSRSGSALTAAVSTRA